MRACVWCECVSHGNSKLIGVTAHVAVDEVFHFQDCLLWPCVTHLSLTRSPLPLLARLGLIVIDGRRRSVTVTAASSLWSDKGSASWRFHGYQSVNHSIMV